MLNPTINSYKRLVPGWFAPVNVSWGLENRSCAVRAIRGEDPHRWRIECRRPGADANPYLALAALAASAADGMRRGATPGEPIVGDASERSDLRPLPGSLESALRAFDEDLEFRACLARRSATTTGCRASGSCRPGARRSATGSGSGMGAPCRAGGGRDPVIACGGGGALVLCGGGVLRVYSIGRGGGRGRSRSRGGEEVRISIARRDQGRT